ncbi:MAG TPA: GDP-fucose synthetase [Oxalobacteraceae bacterium]|nr:GDP-fucose synthetase [Oxalobacteraceae bacterium]
MRIFLTGASGMVGRNFLEHGAAIGYEILQPGSRELDLRDYAAVYDWMKRNKPDVVVHAAGKVGGIQANMREPVNFLLDNLDIGRNIVIASRNLGINKLLNLGSSCMYPRNAMNPLQEEMVLQGELEPTNEGYAIAKITVARLCEYIMRENAGYQYKTLIPCNIYGRHDKFDPAKSHMVPAIIHKLHKAKVEGLDSVDIWGDGYARREFMYAQDLADCMWRAIEQFDSLPHTMNVGLGDDLSVNEYYKVAAKVIGYKGKFCHDLSKPAGMKQKLVSIDKATAWGWHASTSLEAGISLTYQYYLEECKS